MAITPRLDNLEAMQSRPLGTNTALYRDPSALAVGRQYKQQKSDYDMARRLLRRQARRGSTDAAMGLIGLGKDAAKEGVEFGMQDTQQRDAAIAGRTAMSQQQSVDAINKQRNDQSFAREMNSGLAAGRTPTPTTTAPAAPTSVWDAPASTALGGRVYEELGRRGGADVGFRQGLDRAIGMAKTDAERSELGLAAKEAGISDQAFKRRTDWWNKKR